MKENIKAFLTIFVLCFGTYLTTIGIGNSYHDPDTVVAILGIVLVSIGLTATWEYYSKSRH